MRRLVFNTRLFVPGHFWGINELGMQGYRQFITLLALCVLVCFVYEIYLARLANNTLTHPKYGRFRGHFITNNYEGRTGNLMFKYAAVFGCGRRNDLIPLIPDYYFPLRSVFKLTAESGGIELLGMHNILEERDKLSNTYDNRMEVLDGSTYLIGFFQSWKYFRHHEDEIRKQFTFHDDILTEAKEVLTSILPSDYEYHATLIGVHVRRGDMEYLKDIGYSLADRRYLLRAMRFMRKRFGKVIFVVASDDPYWCETELKMDDVVFSTASRSEVDLALLSLCRHTIITVGSFGWWAAWLAGGETIYYKNWPLPNTELYKKVSHEDYFPPKWIPM